ncbi:MAG: EamA family transporter [Acidimicrobiia bacterium]|jgi:drug/metabolite transporter (DMT)-like permease|nr:EamA family transporter [Thermoanaerobacterales bacterium]
MSRRGWVLFLAMGVIWGIPYLLIKVAVEEVAPASLVFARTALAALLLLPIAAARGALRPVLSHWRPLLVYSAVELCLPWLMLGYAEQHLSSSLAGLLVAAVPLVGAVLVKVTGHEQMGLRRVAGLLVGFAGVAALVGFDVETSSPWPVAAMGLVAFGYALGPLVLVRHLAHLPSLGVVTASLVVTCLAYLPVGLAQWPDEAPGGDTWLALAGLAVICTALAFLVFFELVAEVGPSRSTVITYVNPVVALFLGWAVLDERITVVTGLGFALILVGSIVATQREEEPAPAGGPAPAPTGDGASPELATDDMAACPVPEP